ncbi:hypothetical protein [Salinirussus salinus]|uniref:hypothetical protein n=1 Tax=Salinirussus salinus TaxID=1198300 RepID=UPI00135C8EB6|nr:hypothetical protein [Salinirussus salinus]
MPADGGIGLRTVARLVTVPVRKVVGMAKTKKEWQREEVVEPLLDEIAEASRGDLPGSRGRRRSEWEGLNEAIRDRVQPDLQAMFGVYVDHLTELNNIHKREVRMGREMVSLFPEGRMEDEIPVFPTETVSEAHGAQHSDPELMTGEVVEWVSELWEGFESAESAAGLEANLRSMAQRPAIGFGEGVIDYWDTNLEHPPWNERLWELHRQEIIREFYEIKQDREHHRTEAVQKAGQIEDRLRKRNRGSLFR